MIGRALGVAIAVMAALVGCTATPSSPLPRSTSGSREPGAALVGLWRVRAAGEGADTWVRIAPREVDVIRGRLLVFASWATGGNRIVAQIVGFDGRVRDPTAAWLTRASRFARDGDGWVLRSTEGADLARLRVDGVPPVPRGGGPEDTRAPTIAAADESRLEVPATPPGSAPSGARALVGVWRTGTAASGETQPSLAFDADGRYRGTDGCNGFDGSWLLLPDGRLLITSGASSLTACDNAVPTDEWVGRTRSVRIAADRLTLYDVGGTSVGVLHR